VCVCVCACVCDHKSNSTMVRCLSRQPLWRTVFGI